MSIPFALLQAHSFYLPIIADWCADLFIYLFVVYLLDFWIHVVISSNQWLPFGFHDLMKISFIFLILFFWVWFVVLSFFFSLSFFLPFFFRRLQLQGWHCQINGQIRVTVLSHQKILLNSVSFLFSTGTSGTGMVPPLKRIRWRHMTVQLASWRSKVWRCVRRGSTTAVPRTPSPMECRQWPSPLRLKCALPVSACLYSAGMEAGFQKRLHVYTYLSF